MKKLKLPRYQPKDALVPEETKPVKAKAAVSALPTGRRLARRSWRDFRAHWVSYLLITGLVAVPVNALMLFSSLASNSGYNAYSTVASMFMNVALIYAIVYIADGRGAPSLRLAYYEGSASVLRFILVSLALLAMLLPAALGVAIYSLGTSSATGVPLAEAILLFITMLVLAVPSLWLLVRFGFGVYAVVQDGLAPIAALRASRDLTLGRFWRVAVRLLFLGLVVVGVAVLAYIPSVAVGLLLRGSNIPDVLYQILLTLGALPMAHLYMLKLYRDLKKTAHEV